MRLNAIFPRKKQVPLIGLLSVILLLTGIHAFAKQQAFEMVSATAVIEGLSEAIAQINKTAEVPVIFPTEIPHNPAHAQYYATVGKYEKQPGVSYQIFIDTTKDCDGVKVCNVGTIRAERGASPAIQYNREDQEMTQSIRLSSQRKVYFTPSYAMGDYFPAMVQWREKGTLYTITWNVPVKSERELLIRMVNSVR